MSLGYILNEVCQKLGYDPTNDRTLLLSFINRAQKEVYESTDLPGCLREMTISALADNTVALPYYIGELRSMRSHYTYEKIELRELSMKYSYEPWSQIWNNWRIVKKSPLLRTIRNAVIPIKLTMANINSVAVAITVTGKTQTASRTTETATFNPGEVEINLANNYLEIYSVTKDAPSNADITFTGLDENSALVTLAVLPNDRVVSTYTIVDISMLPAVGDLGSAYRYVDVLFKSPLELLTDDGQEFICGSIYDDAIVSKVCQHVMETIEGMGDKAAAYYAKCNQLIFNTVRHTNGASDKEILMAPQGYFGLYPRYGFCAPYRGYPAGLVN